MSQLIKIKVNKDPQWTRHGNHSTRPWGNEVMDEDGQVVIGFEGELSPDLNEKLLLEILNKTYHAGVVAAREEMRNALGMS